MTEGLFHTTCPSCGGSVHSHSASAKTLVCPYCRSLLIRDGAGVHDSGEDSAPFEDYSPLQIGTTGHDQGQNFTIVGRLQARYDAGVWNEWNLYYDDGSSGWLSESGDQYVLTRPATTSAALPRFADIRAGESRLTVDGHTYLAADVRDITLERASAEGELPYPFNGTRHNRVADYRSENHFLTLDYGEDPPEIYMGRGVTLADLALANTRSDAQILDSAGALKGSRASGNCPHCGAPVDWLRGITPTIICPSCGSDLASDNLIASARAVSAQQQTIADRHSLPLGAEATIHGHPYTLIGLVYKEEIGEGTGWTEYLLYHPQQGFLWLVETDGGEWSVSETLNEWPALDGRGAPRGMNKLYDYRSRVRHAAGAFYWHIQKGDELTHHDYDAGKQEKLSAEQNAHELNWSRNIPVSRAQIETWFGRKLADNGRDNNNLQSGFIILVIAYLIVNIPAWLSMSGDTLAASIVMSGFIINALYRIGKKSDGEDEEDDD